MQASGQAKTSKLMLWAGIFYLAIIGLGIGAEGILRGAIFQGADPALWAEALARAPVHSACRCSSICG